MNAVLTITGYFLILLALFHVVFPVYFKWAQELLSISLVTRQIVYVHTFFIGLTLLLMGLLCLTASSELQYTLLGRKVALGLSIFWLARLFIQWFIFSPRLWKGKIFETGMHVLFTFFWISLSTVFILIYLTNK